MKFTTQFRLVFTHGVLFALLTALGFLGSLALYIQFVPQPLASALSDLTYFVPMVALGALILGMLQGVVVLWLHAKNQNLFWVVQVILALTFGGLASFFSIWLIWVVVALINLFLVWVLCLLIHRQQQKNIDMPS